MTDLVISSVSPVKVFEQYTGPAGETVVAGQYARFNTTTGKIELGKATTAAEARSGGILLNGGAAGTAVTFVKRGLLDVGDALAALTYDDDVFLSDTDGTLADAAGTVSKIVGQVYPGFGNTTPDKLLSVNL